MIDIDIAIDTRSANQFVDIIGRKGIERATVRALNGVATSVRKEQVKNVRAFRRVKAAEVRKAIDKINARPSPNPTAILRGSRVPIPLREFAAKWSGRKGNKRVVVNISGEKKTLGDNVFIVSTIGGHVFRRLTDHALPIKKMFGPSIGSALFLSPVHNATKRTIADRWGVLFTRHVKHELHKAEKKAGAGRR